MENILPKRFQTFRRSRGLTQEKMGEKLGIGAKYVGMIERGDKKVDVSSSLGKLFYLMEKSPLYTGIYLEEERLEMDDNKAESKSGEKISPVTSAANASGSESYKDKKNRMIPVISWAHAGESQVYDELPEGWLDSVPTLCPDERAFGLKLEGDSMSPRFQEGAELVVSPSEEAYSGQYVVVRFKGYAGVLFRRVEIAGNVVTLIPENERYPIVGYTYDDFEWIYPVYGVFERLMS